MSSVKPVPLDLELEFHERLIHTIGKGISRTKKKLADSELMLNVRPPDNEVANLIEWTAKKNKLFEQKDVLVFPTLMKIKKENDEKNLLNSLTIGRQQTESNVKWNKRMNKELQKQAELLRKSILNAHANFGTVVEGTEIKKIENYRGNTVIIEGTTRTLHTREGKYQPLDVSKSSGLPSWMGPQFYKETGGQPQFPKPDSHYKLPFNQTPRQEELLQGVREHRSRIGQRREQINQYKQQLNSTGSIASNDGTISSTQSNVSHMLEDLNEGFDSNEGPKQIEGNLRSQRGVLITDNHLPLTETGQQKSGSVVVDIVNDHSSQIVHSPSSQHTLPSPFSRVDSISGATATADLVQHNTTTHLASSGGSKNKRRQSLQRSKSEQLLMTRAFRDVDEFTAKLLKATDPDFCTRRRTISKSTDYTFNAFAKYPLPSNNKTAYEPDDKDAPLSSSLGLYQNVRSSNTPSGTHSSTPSHSSTTSHISTPPHIGDLGIFTSDIFVVKPPDYIPPKERLHLDLIGNDNTTKHRPKTMLKSSFIRDDKDRSNTNSAKSKSKPSTGRTISPTSAIPIPVAPLSPSILNDDSDSHITATIHQWYKNNDIIQGQKFKRISARKTLLDKYSVLPSTELSLNGLLLEENPYLPTDPFLKDVVYDI